MSRMLTIKEVDRAAGNEMLRKYFKTLPNWLLLSINGPISRAEQKRRGIKRTESQFLEA